MERKGTFFNLDKEGGMYSCNNCLTKACNNDIVEIGDRNEDFHSFKWKDLRIMPVGYKGKYRIYLKCDKCGKIITVPEEIIPKWRLFRLKCRLVF